MKNSSSTQNKDNTMKEETEQAAITDNQPCLNPSHIEQLHIDATRQVNRVNISSPCANSNYISATNTTLDEDIKKVYSKLKNGEIYPQGNFDSAGRWHLKSNQDLISVRTPSRKCPYSYLHACRTLKYVKKVVKKYNCKNEREILEHI